MQVSDVATTTKLAELGVVFFLFEMGLEQRPVFEILRFGFLRDASETSVDARSHSIGVLK